MNKIILYHAGYDYFTPDPGEWEFKRCKACGMECDVERNHIGQRTRWGSNDSVFDIFSCPNADVSWHTEVIKILQAIKDTPSKRIAAIMKKDVDDLLIENITDVYALQWMEVSDAY